MSNFDSNYLFYFNPKILHHIKSMRNINRFSSIGWDFSGLGVNFKHRCLLVIQNRKLNLILIRICHNKGLPLLKTFILFSSKKLYFVSGQIQSWLDYSSSYHYFKKMLPINYVLQIVLKGSFF